MNVARRLLIGRSEPSKCPTSLPADPAVRFLLSQVAQPKCTLSQLVIVAAERPVDHYIAWIGRQRVACLPPGRVSIVDCFSDPCGWYASWAPEVAIGKSAAPHATSDTVHVRTATRDSDNGFQDIVAAVRGMQEHSRASHTEATGTNNSSGGSHKTLVVLDSVSCLLLRSGVQDVTRMLRNLCALPATSVAFVLHTGVCLSPLLRAALLPTHLAACAPKYLQRHQPVSRSSISLALSY